LLVVSQSVAESVTPGVATTVVVGRPSGVFPMGRADAARTGRTPDRLPDRPALIWQWAAGEALGFGALAVDARGSVVVASFAGASVAQISRDGRDEWKGKTGSAPPIGGPVILSDGTRAVVTAAGVVFGFDAEGRRRFVTELGLQGKAARTAPLALDDGGFAVGSANEVFFVSADGQVQGRCPIGERPAGALVQTARGVVVSTDTGSVYLARPPAFAAKVGSFGGDPGPGGAASDKDTLVAVVDHNRIVALDLRTGNARRLATPADLLLDGPVTLGTASAVMATTLSGLLVAFSPDGAEIRRTVLDARAISPITAAGTVNLAAISESPPLVTDAAGRVAFARVGGRVGVLSPDGTLAEIDQAHCAAPVALAPAGKGRLVVACRNGSVLMLGDAIRP
jgi:outer membrane protein assembly factor BamB